MSTIQPVSGDIFLQKGRLKPEVLHEKKDEQRIASKLLSEKSWDVFKKVHDSSNEARKPEFTLKTCTQQEIKSGKELIAGRVKQLADAQTKEESSKTTAKIGFLAKTLLLIAATGAIALQPHVVITMIGVTLLLTFLVHAQQKNSPEWAGSNFSTRLFGYSEIQEADRYVAHCTQQLTEAKQEFNKKVSVLEGQHQFFSRRSHVSSLKQKIKKAITEAERERSEAFKDKASAEDKKLISEKIKQLNDANSELGRLACFHETHKIKVKEY